MVVAGADGADDLPGLASWKLTSRCSAGCESFESSCAGAWPAGAGASSPCAGFSASLAFSNGLCFSSFSRCSRFKSPVMREWPVWQNDVRTRGADDDEAHLLELVVLLELAGDDLLVPGDLLAERRAVAVADGRPEADLARVHLRRVLLVRAALLLGLLREPRALLALGLGALEVGLRRAVEVDLVASRDVLVLVVVLVRLALAVALAAVRCARDRRRARWRVLDVGRRLRGRVRVRDGLRDGRRLSVFVVVVKGGPLTSYRKAEIPNISQS